MRMVSFAPAVGQIESRTQLCHTLSRTLAVAQRPVKTS
jgi:hypothetical protein